jgi:hypothetical protein
LETLVLHEQTIQTTYPITMIIGPAVVVAVLVLREKIQNRMEL